MMRNHMMTKMRMNGTNWRIISVPPPAGAPCAKAGEMNKRLSMDKSARRALVDAHPRQTGFKAWRTILIDSTKSMKLLAFPKPLPWTV
jgi:hypothetical protein